MYTKKQGKSYGLLVVAAIVVLSVFNLNAASAKNPKVLVFGLSAAFAHTSIPAGMAAIQKLGRENKFDCVLTFDADDFNDANLKQFAAVIFVSTTGDFFKTDAQKEALRKFIQKGGGYVGIHAASDAEKQWPWYGELVGAYFKQHPNGVPLATIDVVDKTSIATKFLPARWERKDEWYAYTALPKNVNVLLKLDESSLPAGTYDGRFAGAKMGGEHPLAWWHDYDGGRAFYTALGHPEASFAEPFVLQHILGGIEYAIGRKKMQ